MTTSNRHAFVSSNIPITLPLSFLAEVRAKNVYQSMAAQDFPGKENIKTANYVVIGAADTIKIGADWSK